jgi:hypothetical protein
MLTTGAAVTLEGINDAADLGRVPVGEPLFLAETALNLGESPGGLQVEVR